MKTPPRPKFDVGDKISYRRTGRNGVIQGFVNFGDAEDIAVQGYRYYVLIGREIRSIPEEKLWRLEKANSSKPKRVEASFILPENQSLPRVGGSTKELTPEEALIKKEGGSDE